MIKVKILNPDFDRNIPTFNPLIRVKDMLRDYSIDLTEDDDFDYMFIGMSDFLDKNHLPIPEPQIRLPPTPQHWPDSSLMH